MVFLVSSALGAFIADVFAPDCLSRPTLVQMGVKRTRRVGHVTIAGNRHAGLAITVCVAVS